MANIKGSGTGINIVEQPATSGQCFWALEQLEIHTFMAKNRFYVENKSTIIPLSLSLTIYGISSIVPCDLFNVDYLPTRYINNVYFI